MVVIMGCRCRICGRIYNSLLRSTACCREMKMKRKVDVVEQPVKFKTSQAKLKEFHPHEIAWQELLSELREMGYPDRSGDSKSR